LTAGCPLQANSHTPLHTVSWPNERSSTLRLIPNDPGDVFGETVQSSYLSKRIGFHC
jgi:hypothetical protein